MGLGFFLGLCAGRVGGMSVGLELFLCGCGFYFWELLA